MATYVLFVYSELALAPMETGLAPTHAARFGWCSQDVLAQLSKLEPEDPRRPAAVDLVTSNFDKFGDNGEVRLVSSHPIPYRPPYHKPNAFYLCTW